MDYSICMVEWDRVEKDVSMGRLCCHIIKRKGIVIGVDSFMYGRVRQGRKGCEYG